MISVAPAPAEAGIQSPAMQIWRWLVIVLYVLALLVGTHLPDDHPAVTTALRMTGNDRSAHFLAYTGLAALVIGLGRVAPGRLASVGTLLGLAAFGAADELTQPWFARSAEWLDWMADVAGLIVGLCVGRAWLRWNFRFGDV